MTILHNKFRSIYNFNKSNTNYINAIKKYGKKVFIDQFNGFPMGDKTCSDLTSMISHSLSDEISIKCSSSGSNSTIGVFPMLDSNKLLSEVPDEMKKIPSSVIAQNLEIISKRLDERRCFRSGIYEDPYSFTKSEAVLLFTQLQEKYKNEISGVMHFPKREIILFQFGEENFLLKYGKHPKFSVMPNMFFDLDDGFKIENGCEHEEHLVCYELQKHFNRWKSNRYEGEVIPARNSGFQSYRDAASFDPSKNVHSFWQMSGASAVLAGLAGLTLGTVTYVAYKNSMR